jgi:hypothetical protein
MLLSKQQNIMNARTGGARTIAPLSFAIKIGGKEDNQS